MFIQMLNRGRERGPTSLHISSSQSSLLAPFGPSQRKLSDCCDNRFIVKIALHYGALTGYGRYTSTCD